MQPRDNKLKYDQYLSTPQLKNAESIIENAVFINATDETPF